MPICIECRYPVSTLYSTYSKADDKSLGKGVRLTQCPRCKRFADKYVEHDFVVLFIDLVLIKPPVYRHLLFNRLSREGDRFDPSIIRLGVLLLLFDVYLTWARIEKATPSPPQDALSTHLSSYAGNSSDVSNSTGLGVDGTGRSPSEQATSNFLASQPILLQYFFFLALCTLETASFHLPIRTLLSIRFPRPISLLIPYYPHSALISTALLVSSFTKLFPLLLLIWPYDLPSSASAVSWAVIINNVAALEILLDCGFVRAIFVAAIGAIFRAGVGWSILRTVGVGGGVAAAGIVETGDLIELWKRLVDHIGLA